MALFTIKPPFTLVELKAEYRKLSKQYHPDTGGTVQLFQQLGAEFAQLKRQVGVKPAVIEIKIDVTDVADMFKKAMNPANFRGGISSISIATRAEFDESPLWKVTHKYDGLNYEIVIKLPEYVYLEGFYLKLTDYRFNSDSYVLVPPFVNGKKQVVVLNGANFIIDFKVQQ